MTGDPLSPEPGNKQLADVEKGSRNVESPHKVPGMIAMGPIQNLNAVAGPVMYGGGPVGHVEAANALGHVSVVGAATGCLQCELDNGEPTSQHASAAAGVQTYISTYTYTQNSLAGHALRFMYRDQSRMVVPGLTARPAQHVGPSDGSDDADSPEIALRQVRARKELNEFAEVRAVRRATTEGLSQRTVANLLGTSQTNVHRLLRKGRVVDDRRGPREVILRYVAGEISRGALVGLLSEISRGLHTDHGGDGYAPGTWDEVRSAFLDGLLAELEYEEIRSSLGNDEAGGHGG